MLLTYLHPFKHTKSKGSDIKQRRFGDFFGNNLWNWVHILDLPTTEIMA